jgi:hypothetical protein
MNCTEQESAWAARKEGSRVRGRRTGESEIRKVRLENGEEKCKRGTMYRAPTRAKETRGGQLPAGAWSHLRALRQGAESLLRIGVFSQTTKL